MNFAIVVTLRSRPGPKDMRVYSSLPSLTVALPHGEQGNIAEAGADNLSASNCQGFTSMISIFTSPNNLTFDRVQ